MTATLAATLAGVGGEAYRRNGDGCECKGVANYVAHVDATATVLPRVLHFA